MPTLRIQWLRTLMLLLDLLLHVQMIANPGKTRLIDTRNQNQSYGIQYVVHTSDRVVSHCVVGCPHVDSTVLATGSEHIPTIVGHSHCTHLWCKYRAHTYTIVHVLSKLHVHVHVYLKWQLFAGILYILGSWAFFLVFNFQKCNDAVCNNYLILPLVQIRRNIKR